MEPTDKDSQATELLHLYGSIENYIANDRDEICEAIRNNPVYDNKIMLSSDFEVRGDGKHYSVEELADEVICFCGALLERLRAWRKDKYKTAEILDCTFRAFPVKRDTTLDGCREQRGYFIDMLRSKGLTDEEIVRKVNALPGCCAGVVENILFRHIGIDYTFRHAYNHLRVCRNCRSGLSGYKLLEVDEDKLKALIYIEKAKENTKAVVPQNQSFSLKQEYYKRRKEFAEKLYSLLNERTIPYIADETDVDTFREVLLTRDHMKEECRIRWACDTTEVYYITNKLMAYFDGLTFDHFGKLCISRKGTVLKNLCANKTDNPRHKSDIDSIFEEFNDFLQRN